MSLFYNVYSVAGKFEAILRGVAPCGKNISCKATVYVSESIKGFYLSCSTMRSLGIIDNDFPTIGSTANSSSNTLNKSNEPCMPCMPCINVRAVSAGCEHPHDDLVTCSCPQRMVVPERPTSLPFDPIPENNSRMRQWLLDRYASSTFNTCLPPSSPSVNVQPSYGDRPCC